MSAAAIAWLAVAGYVVGLVGMMRWVVCDWVAAEYADLCRKYPHRVGQPNRQEALGEAGAWWMGAACGLCWPLILICAAVWWPIKLVAPLFGRWFVAPATKRMAES